MNYFVFNIVVDTTSKILIALWEYLYEENWTDIMETTRMLRRGIQICEQVKILKSYFQKGIPTGMLRYFLNTLYIGKKNVLRQNKNK